MTDIETPFCQSEAAMLEVSDRHFGYASRLASEAAEHFLPTDTTHEEAAAFLSSYEAINEGQRAVIARREAETLRKSHCGTCLAQNPELMQQILEGNDTPGCAIAEYLAANHPDSVRDTLYAEAGLLAQTEDVVSDASV